MKDNVIHMKDFVKNRTEERMLEAIDMCEEALGCRDYTNAREFYWVAHMIYAESGKEITHISNRMNDLEESLFFR